MHPLLLLLASLAWAQSRFPTLRVENLAGQPVALPPRDAALPTVVLVGFQRHHHADAESWFPVLRPLSATGQAEWVECAFIGEVNPLLQSVIFNTMRVTLREDDLRHSVTPAFVDGTPWQQALGLPDQEQLAVVLFDTSGGAQVVGAGPRGDAVEARLRALLATD